ncbi:hypothetical protein G6F22_017813 [Rhizopus arrhizus]|nr:hypothetical protein G6F22_017813 [Rhizopus arrhizus]
MASEAGFDLSLRPTEYAALQKESSAGNFQIVMLGWSGRVDPDGNVHAFVTCKGALNDGHYCNPEVDKLLNEARTVPDEAKRKELYDQAQTIIQDELPGVYNYYQPWPFAMGKKVKGFTPYPDGMIRLKGGTFAQKGRRGAAASQGRRARWRRRRVQRFFAAAARQVMLA